MAAEIEGFANVLETYRGREKIMRLIQYASFLASGGLQKFTFESSGAKFRILAEALSECRTVLRLFDDAAMFSYARNYGTGKEVGYSRLQYKSMMTNNQGAPHNHDNI